MVLCPGGISDGILVIPDIPIYAAQLAALELLLLYSFILLSKTSCTQCTPVYPCVPNCTQGIPQGYFCWYFSQF